MAYQGQHYSYLVLLIVLCTVKYGNTVYGIIGRVQSVRQRKHVRRCSVAALPLSLVVVTTAMLVDVVDDD